MAEIMVMVIKTAINIQEDKMVEVMEVVEWVDMTVAPTMDIMVDAASLQEVSMVATVLIGALVGGIGEQVVMKDVTPTVGIPKINI